MNIEEIHQELITTLDKYHTVLMQYNFNQLTTITDAADWSLSQVFTHLFEQTNEFNFKQIDFCLSSDEFASFNKNKEGEEFFNRGGFPDERIKAPFDDIPEEPISIDSLYENLEKLKIQLAQYKISIQNSSISGKAQHPGFGYLSAVEWYAFILMHFRHHLRQVARIEKHL